MIKIEKYNYNKYVFILYDQASFFSFSRKKKKTTNTHCKALEGIIYNYRGLPKKKKPSLSEWQNLKATICKILLLKYP